MKQQDQKDHLHYLWECPVGQDPTRLNRRVRLLSRALPFPSHEVQGNFSILPYKAALALEQRDPDCASGIWGISCHRSTRIFGNVPLKYAADDLPHASVSAEVWEKARAFRTLVYYQITTANEAIAVLGGGRGIDYGCEITEDWYDPPKGNVPLLSENPTYVSSHAVALAAYSPEHRKFVFENSWGKEWGDRGFGSFPLDNWERALIDAWDGFGGGQYIPTRFSSGTIVRGWKLGTDFGQGVHCIEIYDVDRDENVAWAFVVLRGSSLDVDEFFVSPGERGKGYARVLCHHVQILAEKIKKPIRLVVTFADSEDYAIDGVFAVAKMFGVNLVEPDVRWAAKFGVANGTSRVARNWKPARCESFLEKLRPRVEPPLRDPRQYTVFFGTNRKPVDENNLSKGFLNERGYELHRGHCLVEIPATHKFGSVGRGWISFLKKAEGARKRIKTIQPLTSGQMQVFAGKLIGKFESKKHNLLFLHGFKNSFEDAALRAAQLGVDLKLPGLTFFYSWPAKGSLKGYHADEATIETSVQYCLAFVLEILKAFPEVPLHIVAHSMGNRLAVKTLEKLAILEDVPGRLGQLVFAAADIDVDLFAQSIPSIKHLSERMTAYTSRGDLAVHLSERIHDFPRVGLAPPIQCFSGVDTVLAEGFAVSELMGHDYVVESAPLLTDLFNLIRYGSEPDDRPRTIREFDSKSKLPFWSLPLD